MNNYWMKGIGGTIGETTCVLGYLLDGVLGRFRRRVVEA